MTSVFDHPWLGALFGDPDISALWSAEAQLAHYRAFEAALAESLGVVGRVEAEHARTAAEVARSSKIDLAHLAEGTAQDGLPIPAFIRALRDVAGEAAPAIHTGATSQDVLDTALALTLRAVSDVLLDGLGGLNDALAELIAQHGRRALMGRTRMQAALPITVADRVETWRQPLHAHIDAVIALRPRVEQLQLGGAVGTRAAFEGDADRIAAHVAQSLGLALGPVWHTDRSGIVDYASRLSLVTGTLGKIGQDIALMAQQGVGDVALTSGGGSSAMPHKSNPIRAELLVTLARFNATQVAGMHHAMIHEQERSGAAWALEWMILPQMTSATARALAAATELARQVERIGS
ncbi:MAG: 3-carboxy-cis,cis-muconate cycloisomerase [Pseudomonadota bacterium]